MKRNTISLRRRHLLLAGLAGVAAPATLFAGQGSGTLGTAPAVAAFFASGSGGAGRLVVSGRILASDRKPLAGAMVEVWHAGAKRDYSASSCGKPNGVPCASVTTDGDGRFMFTTLAPTGYSGRPRHICYRVSSRGHETVVRQLGFAPARSVSDDRIAQLQRDAAGTWRATFGLTLA